MDGFRGNFLPLDDCKERVCHRGESYKNMIITVLLFSHPTFHRD
jgi:hypothetical protein